VKFLTGREIGSGELRDLITAFLLPEENIVEWSWNILDRASAAIWYILVRLVIVMI